MILLKIGAIKMMLINIFSQNESVKFEARSIENIKILSINTSYKYYKNVFQQNELLRTLSNIHNEFILVQYMKLMIILHLFVNYSMFL